MNIDNKIGEWRKLNLKIHNNQNGRLDALDVEKERGYRDELRVILGNRDNKSFDLNADERFRIFKD